MSLPETAYLLLHASSLPHLLLGSPVHRPESCREHLQKFLPQAEKEVSQKFSNPTSEFAQDAVAIKEKELSLGRYLTEEQRAQYDARIKELELLHNKLLE